MADLESRLQRLSERGTPVGVEELIERIEAELAGDPLVVVTKRREGALMTKTDRTATKKSPGPGRGLAWAIAGFALILGLGGLYFAFNADDGFVVDQTTVAEPPTTTPAPVETMTDLEIIEAGVAALYSGDADTAVELFDLPLKSDAAIREEATYQATVRGRLTLNCAQESDGAFLCTTPYHNALTDAIGVVDSGNEIRIRVNEGQIVGFDGISRGANPRGFLGSSFPEHSWINRSIGLFLLTGGRFYGYEECLEGASSPSCGRIQMQNLEGWSQWYLAMDPIEVVNLALGAWYNDDCPVAVAFAEDHPSDCSMASNRAADMIAYETILGGSAATDHCVVAEEDGSTVVTCDVSYSNAMNSAVDKGSAVITRDFHVDGTVAPQWYATKYPRDAALDASFAEYADANGLEAYGAGFCTISPTADCAHLIMDNLDDWAAWHQDRQ